MRLLIGSCEETRDRLSDHLEGELTPSRDRRLQRHLRYCRRCRSVYESLVRTVERVRALGLEDNGVASVSVVRAVLERVRSDGPRRPPEAAL